jgi:hypothetical protein
MLLKSNSKRASIAPDKSKDRRGHPESQSQLNLKKLMNSSFLLHKIEIKLRKDLNRISDRLASFAPSNFNLTMDSLAATPAHNQPLI